jgi:hypothetical protein
MDLPITARTRSILLRYQSNAAVPDDAARAALPVETLREEMAAVELRPFGDILRERPRDPQAWIPAFHANDQFADQLLMREAELGVELPVHLFGRAPLVLMLHLGHRLKRRRLIVYQEQRQPPGTWVAGFDTAHPTPREPFFQIEGLPAKRQGGRGHVALTIEVTHPGDAAIQAFQARYPSELLATVRMRPMRDSSHASVGGPGDVASAVNQFREVLDAIHRCYGGAASVLVALACPAGLAAALGTAINPETHPHLLLHHHFPNTDEYLPVHLLQDRRRSPEPGISAEQRLEAAAVLQDVREVHEDLVGWLAEPAQVALKELLGGGDGLLRSKVNGTPTAETEPVYAYLRGEWTFHTHFLLGLKALRQRLPSPEDWRECLRVFLVHEVFHIGQRGPTSYSYSGSGRTSWVLEAVDYDADALSFEAALRYRRSRQSGTVNKDGATLTLSRVLWNALECGRVFEPERPVSMLSERRLRRYLIGLFHACRLSALAARGIEDTTLDRVFIEIAGLKTSPDPHEVYFQQSVRLDQLEDDRGGESLTFAVYFRKQLAKSTDRAWIAGLLRALRNWEVQPREQAQRQIKDLFGQFFDQHRFLVDRA